MVTHASSAAGAGEFYFYGKALNFKAEMPEDLEPLEIANAVTAAESALRDV